MCTPTRQWATFITPGCVVGFCLLYDQKAEYVEQLKCLLLGSGASRVGDALVGVLAVTIA